MTIVLPHDPGASALIETERDRQNAMWGGPAHDDLHDVLTWFTILCRQEVHVAEAVDGFRDLVTELTQLCAVAQAWLAVEIRRNTAAEQELT